MKKLLLLFCSGLMLMAIEYVLCVLFFYLEDIYKYDVNSSLSYNLRGASEVNALRLIFYFPLWLITMYYLFDGINKKRYPALRLAAANCVLYILISVIMSIVFSAGAFFGYSFFYFLIISTLISPFILWVIPFGNKLIKSI